MLVLILALLSTDISQAQSRQNASNCKQRPLAHNQQVTVGVQVTKPTTLALLAQEPVEVINNFMASIVASAGVARAQTGVIGPKAADTIMPSAFEPAAPAVPFYECRSCRDRLHATAYGSHRNGQQHVKC
jgi:hypothetical protein